MFNAESLRKESFLTDVVLQCQGREYVAHKLILSSVSPFFKKQISGMDKTTVDLDFINYRVLEDILQYCYTGCFHFQNKTQLHLKELTEASVFLENPLLSKYCLRLLLSGSSGDHVTNNWKLIEQLKSETVKRIFLEDLLNNLSSLKTNEEFLALDAAQLDSIFQSLVIHSCDHDEILESIISWVKHNVKAREKHLNRYLNKVDFDMVSCSLLVKLQHESLLENNVAFLNAYKEAFTHLVTSKKVTFNARPKHKNLKASSKLSLESPKILQPKKPLEATTPAISKRLEVTGVIYEQTKHQSPSRLGHYFNASSTPDATKVVQSLPPNTTSLLAARRTAPEVPTVSQSKINARSTPDGKKVVQSLPLNTTSLLATRRTIVAVAKVSQSRSLFVYCCDGNDNPKLFHGQYHTDITCSNLTEMINHPLSNTKFPSLCSYKRHLFIFGGYCLKTKQFLSSCYAYDTSNHQWCRRKDMPEARCFTKAVELKGLIYVVGGNYTDNSVWCYDPIEDKWKSVASLPPRSNSSHRTLVAANDTDLFAVVNRFIYIYNTEDDIWVISKQCVPKPMHMIAVEHKLYITESDTKSKYIWIYDMDKKCFDRELIRTELSSCRGIFNLKNAEAAEILIIGEKSCFIYRPPSSWELLDRTNLCESQIISNNVAVEVVY